MANPFGLLGRTVLEQMKLSIALWRWPGTSLPARRHLTAFSADMDTGSARSMSRRGRTGSAQDMRHNK
jgi:hypothetical protein